MPKGFGNLISSFASKALQTAQVSVTSTTNRARPKAVSRGYTQNQSAQVVRSGELTKDDIIVAVMGPTGAGKSTFIESAIGVQGLTGHGLTSYTEGVQAFRATFNDSSSVVLVDTPGFDDTYRSDAQILDLISRWLQETRVKGLHLAGILYLHRISDNRMGGSVLKLLKKFENLCGGDAHAKIIFTTTMWEDVYLLEGIMRENELRDSFWKEMIERNGSKMFRFEDSTKKSAWNILNYIIIQTEHHRRVGEIQEDLAAIRKRAPQGWGKRQASDLIEEAAAQQLEILLNMREKMLETTNPAVMQNYAEQLIGMRKQREAATHQR